MITDAGVVGNARALNKSKSVVILIYCLLMKYNVYVGRRIFFM